MRIVIALGMAAGGVSAGCFGCPSTSGEVVDVRGHVEPMILTASGIAAADIPVRIGMGGLVSAGTHEEGGECVEDTAPLMGRDARVELPGEAPLALAFDGQLYAGTAHYASAYHFSLTTSDGEHTADIAAPALFSLTITDETDRIIVTPSPLGPGETVLSMDAFSCVANGTMPPSSSAGGSYTFLKFALGPGYTNYRFMMTRTMAAAADVQLTVFDDASGSGAWCP
jgi:hypothetical protein